MGLGFKQNEGGKKKKYIIACKPPNFASNSLSLSPLQSQKIIQVTSTINQ
jgi:hypothetical protein